MTFTETIVATASIGIIITLALYAWACVTHDQPIDDVSDDLTDGDVWRHDQDIRA